MLTEAEVRDLLARKTESKDLDYKQSLNWKAAAAWEKGAVVKDVLAMANTANGGRLVFGVRDADFEAVGLTEDELCSFDATRFADFVNKYADPPLACGIHKFVIDGRRFVTIEIPEFADVPVICRADLNDSDNRQVLKKGAIYIRTERAASEIVPTAEAMRELIDRAVSNRGDRFLIMVNRVIEQQTAKKEQADRYEALIDARTSQLRKSLTNLERSYDITLECLGDMLDLRESNAAGHSKRVTAYTIAMARTIDLSADKIRVVARGAFLHDIGKTAIPDAILRKPSALTPEEMTIVRQHCYHGYQVLKKIPFLAEAAEIVYSHHENYDATGYPRGLKGQQIALGARIVAIANTLDSITSDLPYRPAQTYQAAREEIEKCSGHQFDPEIVEVFLSMPENIWFELAREIDRQAGRPGAGR